MGRGIMSDDEWVSIGNRTGMKRKDAAKLYVRRLSSALDLDNLPKKKADEMVKAFKDAANKVIVKGNTTPPVTEYSPVRPMDVTLP